MTRLRPSIRSSAAVGIAALVAALQVGCASAYDYDDEAPKPLPPDDMTSIRVAWARESAAFGSRLGVSAISGPAMGGKTFSPLTDIKELRVPKGSYRIVLRYVWKKRSTDPLTRETTSAIAVDASEASAYVLEVVDPTGDDCCRFFPRGDEATDPSPSPD